MAKKAKPVSVPVQVGAFAVSDTHAQTSISPTQLGFMVNDLRSGFGELWAILTAISTCRVDDYVDLALAGQRIAGHLGVECANLLDRLQESGLAQEVRHD